MPGATTSGMLRAMIPLDLAIALSPFLLMGILWLMSE